MNKMFNKELRKYKRKHPICGIRVDDPGAVCTVIFVIFVIFTLPIALTCG